MATCECGCGESVAVARSSSTKYGWVKGQPVRFVRGHHSRMRAPKRYPAIGVGRTRLAIHRIRAERALGHPLPAKAIVHHVDGSMSPSAPLVICEDQAYHKLLHRRARIVAAGGDPNTEGICSGCRRLKSRDEFTQDGSRNAGISNYCRECNRQRDTARRKRRRK